MKCWIKFVAAVLLLSTVPRLGAFVIYTIMIVVLLWRPQGLFSRTSGK